VLHDVDPDFTSGPTTTAADLDGDGDMDVIGGARGTINDLAWWENVDSMGTTWTEHTIPSSLEQVSAVDTADVNADGYMDIFVSDASYHDIVWLKNLDGSGMNWTEYSIDGSFDTPYDVFGADIDGDGDRDVVGAAFNGDDISWWENADDSGTVWIEHNVSGNFNGARSCIATDLDGDMDTDIIGAASLDWAVTWWENGDGYGNNWVEHVISGNFNYAFAVHTCDVDQDGDNDVLGASYFGDDITLWENTDGVGSIWYEHTIDGSFDGARDVATADMDGDGDPDILGAAAEDADISWWDITCCVTAGELISSIMDTQMGANWDSITWTADEPSGTSVYFQARSSMDPQYMGSWSSDITSPGNLDAYITDGDQYVQYRALLETTDPGVSPTLWDITVSWHEYVGVAEEGNWKPGSKKWELTVAPNPFTASTTIRLSGMAYGAEGVELQIYNVSGRQVKVLPIPYSRFQAVNLAWDGRDEAGQELPSGVYYLRLDAEKYSTIRKLMVLR
jgi:hypothetical protein